MTSLTTRIKQERTKRLERRERVTFFAFPLLLILGLALHGSSRPIGALALAILSGIALPTCLLINLFPTRLEREAWETLLESTEKPDLTTLLEGLSLWPRPLRARVRARLLQTLPQITQAEWSQLEPEQQTHLFNLCHTGDQELIVAVLAMLREAGDQSCLGAIYQFANREVTYTTLLPSHQAARECLDHLFARIDVGRMVDLKHYISSIYYRSEETSNFQSYAQGILSLLRLLPVVTPLQYWTLLSDKDRDLLYRILMGADYRHDYGRRELHLEIIRVAERVGDKQALPLLDIFAPTDQQTDAAVRQAMRVLSSLPERKQDGKTLLRSASAPSTDELLRPATAAESATNPKELIRPLPAMQSETSENAVPLPFAAPLKGLPRSEELQQNSIRKE